MTPDLHQQIDEESKRFREEIKAEPEMTDKRLEELSRIHKQKCREITDNALSEYYAH
jgi:hypothetical protein